MGVTERLARSSSRHPWRTLAAWAVAIVVALAFAIFFLPGNLTTNGHVTGNPESKQAEDLFYERFPPDKNGVDELVVVRSAAHTAANPAFKTFVRNLLQQARATGVVHHLAAQVLGFLGEIKGGLSTHGRQYRVDLIFFEYLFNALNC